MNGLAYRQWYGLWMPCNSRGLDDLSRKLLPAKFTSTPFWSPIVLIPQKWGNVQNCAKIVQLIELCVCLDSRPKGGNFMHSEKGNFYGIGTTKSVCPEKLVLHFWLAQQGWERTFVCWPSSPQFFVDLKAQGQEASTNFQFSQLQLRNWPNSLCNCKSLCFFVKPKLCGVSLLAAAKFNNQKEEKSAVRQRAKHHTFPSKADYQRTFRPFGPRTTKIARPRALLYSRGDDLFFHPRLFPWGKL